MSALLYVAAGVLSAGLTWLVKRHALISGMLDVPNHRSSHQRTVPRGGGLSVVVVTLLGMTTATAAGQMEPNVSIALIGGGALVAAIGWADDRSSQPAAVRLAVHAVAGIWAVGWLHGLPAISVGPASYELGFGGPLVAVIGIIWSINLFNFMDGVDGLAGSEATSVGIFGGLLLLRFGEQGLAIAAFLIAAASAGFLVWNWPPARIFMGDVGSGFLGFIFAALAIASENARAVPIVWWAVLAGVFIVDATITLIRRILRREHIGVAHRSHAYQKAVSAGHSHRGVTSAVIAINSILWLLAWVGLARPETAVSILVLSAFCLGLGYRFVEGLTGRRSL